MKLYSLDKHWLFISFLDPLINQFNLLKGRDILSPSPRQHILRAHSRSVVNLDLRVGLALVK